MCVCTVEVAIYVNDSCMAIIVTKVVAIILCGPILHSILCFGSQLYVGPIIMLSDLYN